MLYNKATDVTLTNIDPASSLTLMSADIERIVTGMQTAHEVWSNTLEVAIAIFLLQRELGAACAIPIGVAIGTSSTWDPLYQLTCRLVSLAGSLGATGLVMQRQAMWLEAIERRIAATGAMLGSMKGVKMCGLTDVLRNDLQRLRVDELDISKKFRKLLIWTMGFCKQIRVSRSNVVMMLTEISLYLARGIPYTHIRRVYHHCAKEG
jgi:hypothetical protein